MRRSVLAACFALVASTALAADPAGYSQPAGATLAAYDVLVTLGGGLQVKPEYEGANSYDLAPMPILGLTFRTNPFTGQPSSETGFGIRPAFRFLSEREGKDELRGLDDVDAAFELGVNLSWTEQMWRVFVEARQGVGGHSGALFDLGADAILRPLPGVTASFGPRVSFATADYVETYFNVSTAEAAASGGKFSPYEADAGLRAYGVGGRIDYEFTPQWLVRLDASYNRLSDDLADSPIVKEAGSADQFTIGIGAAYRFGFNWR